MLVTTLASCNYESIQGSGTIPQVQTIENGPQSPCDGGNGGNCGNAPYFLVSKIVSIPDYPDCSFEITYKIRECNNRYDIIIESFDDSSISDPDQCPQYQQDIQNQNPANQLAFDLFVDQMENKLAKALLLSIASDNPNNVKPCGSQNNPMMMSFISAHCNYYCIYIDVESGGKRRVSTYPCGDICCETRYEVCLLPNGQITYIQQASTNPYGSCDPTNWYRSCPPVTIYQSTCREKCRFRF